MRAIFGQFGPIMDVVSRRTYRLRGQAWVVFENAEDAKRALEIMQGFPFMDKPMVGAAVTLLSAWKGGCALYCGTCTRPKTAVVTACVLPGAC